MSTHDSHTNTARAVYERNPLIRYLNHHHPTIFRWIWDAYLLAHKLRYRSGQLPLHPATPIVQAREWGRPPAASTQTGKRVLFLSFTGWSFHTIMDGLLGRALAMRGADVHYLTCGGILPICYIHNASSDVPPMPCGRCRAYATSGLESFGFQAQQLRHLVSRAKWAELQALAEAIPQEQLVSYTYEGVPIGYYASVSVRWFLLADSVDQSPEMIRNLRGYIFLGLLVYHALTDWFTRQRVDTLMLFNGLQVVEQVAQAVAARHGVQVICTERGYLANTFMAAHGGPVALFPLDNLWAGRYRDQPLNEGEQSWLNEYLNSRRFGHKQMDNLWKEVEARSDVLRNEIGLQPGRPLVSVYTNVAGDTAVIDRDLDFDSIFDWVDHVIAYFRERPEIDVVFRVHPAETRIPRYTPRQPLGTYIAQKHPNLPPNIRVIPSQSTLSSYTLVEMSDLVMVYSSTLGLESAVLGRPVMVSANVHYLDKGFTYTINSAESMRAFLDQWDGTERSLPPHSKELAERYAYLFFRRVMISLDEIMEEGSFGHMRLKVSGWDNLRPGASPLVDSLCDHILNGTPFLDAEA